MDGESSQVHSFHCHKVTSDGGEEEEEEENNNDNKTL